MNPLKTKSLKKIALLCFVLFLGIQGTKAQSIGTPKLLTLDMALEYAETTSPTIIKSKLSITRQQKSLEAQRAAMKSRFSLSADPGSFSRNRRFDNRYSDWYTSQNFSTNTTLTVAQPILITNGTISLSNEFGWQKSKSTTTEFIDGVQQLVTRPNEAFYNNLSLNFSQPLFTYNTLKVTLRQLETSLENANISYAMQRLNMERSVTQQFYQVYVQQENLAIAKSELDDTQKSYELIKSKADAGLVAQEELYQAELNLMQSKLSVENSTVSYENAKDQLKLNLGMDLYEDFAILNVDIANQQEIEIDLDEAIESGLARRMEIRQREIELENSEFSMMSVQAQNEFSGNMNVRVGITGDDPNASLIYSKDNRVTNPSVGVSFNIPIFDWGEKKAKIAAQEAAMESTQIDYDEQKKDIIISIREAYRSIKSQWSQIAIAELSRKNAQLTYDISQERYSNGQITSMDMNLQTRQYTTAQIDYMQAQINYKLELLNMKIQTLYDFEKGVPVIPQELYLNENK